MLAHLSKKTPSIAVISRHVINHYYLAHVHFLPITESGKTKIRSVGLVFAQDAPVTDDDSEGIEDLARDSLGDDDEDYVLHNMIVIEIDAAQHARHVTQMATPATKMDKMYVLPLLK